MQKIAGEVPPHAGGLSAGFPLPAILNNISDWHLILVLPQNVGATDPTLTLHIEIFCRNPLEPDTTAISPSRPAFTYGMDIAFSLAA